jgi:hypothetical protein
MAVTNINIDSQILTFANLSAFPVTGTVKTIYIAEDTDISYYWDGAAYQDITIDTSGLVPAGLITTSGLTMNTGVLLGRGTVGVGAVEEIVIGSGLTLTGTTLSAAGGGITIGTTAISSGTVGRVLFEGAGNVVQQSSNFFWDNTNGRLGIRTVTPTASLEVLGAAASGTGQAFAVHNSTGNNNALIVTNDRRVGIGTSTPTADLEMFKSSGTLLFKLAGGNSGAQIIQAQISGTTKQLQFGGQIELNQESGTILRLRAVTSGTGLVGFDVISGSPGVRAVQLVAVGSSGSGIININKLNVNQIKLTTGSGSDSFWNATDSNAAFVFGGTARTNNSVLVEMQSTNKGFLPPRMTTANRNSISTPATGLTIFNTDNNTINQRTSSAWVDLVSSSNYDGLNIAFGTTNGTKIGTATSEKIGFWNATPIIQPTTAVAASVLVGGGGTTITDTDTFDGYTLQQIVKALRNTGILA